MITTECHGRAVSTAGTVATRIYSEMSIKSQIHYSGLLSLLDFGRSVAAVWPIELIPIPTVMKSNRLNSYLGTTTKEEKLHVLIRLAVAKDDPLRILRSFIHRIIGINQDP